MANFGDYLRDFILYYWEIWSKIWSLPDHSGEVTTLKLSSWIEFIIMQSLTKHTQKLFTEAGDIQEKLGRISVIIRPWLFKCWIVLSTRKITFQQIKLLETNIYFLNANCCYDRISQGKLLHVCLAVRNVLPGGMSVPQ